MPVIDPIVVSILPDDGHSIRPHRNHVVDTRGGRVSHLEIEYFRIGFRAHLLVPAAAGGTWAGSAQQLKWVNAGVIIVPCNGKFPGLFVGGNAGWFFVHEYLAL